MTMPPPLELLGYLASVLVALSLTMRSIVRLRVINLVGSAFFTVYGALIGAYPVAAVNAFIVLINLYYLYTMSRRREFFRLLQLEPGSPYVDAFLRFHADEIGRFFPGFAHAPAAGQVAVLTLRDLAPAGLLLGELRGDTLRVELDFVSPQFRDFKVGRFLFHEQAGFFRGLGVERVAAATEHPQHADYLRRMGFRAAEVDGRPGYVMRLP